MQLFSALIFLAVRLLIDTIISYCNVLSAFTILFKILCLQFDDELCFFLMLKNGFISLFMIFINLEGSTCLE